LLSACIPARRPDCVAFRADPSWRACIYTVLATLPIGFVAIQIASWVRNIPNWDEFDTVLDFLIALDSGASAREFFALLFHVANEHRMLVSRLIFASAWWLFGSVNFIALAVVGNLFLACVFWQLLASVKDVGARLRFAAIFALGVFHLQHHESFFWSGASIDHFFVILAAVVALAALVSPARGALPLACAAGFLATFSLAHGLLVWVAGAVLLWSDGRPRALVVWAAAAGASIIGFFLGFEFNPGHRLPGIADLPAIFVYWLTIAGSSPALDDVRTAPWLGAVLVVGFTGVMWRGWRARERLACAVGLWCLGAMAMIAWGRALLASEWAPVTSRYLILSSMAWALLVWLLVERGIARRGREEAWLVVVFGLLIAFNIAASAAHRASGRIFARNGERAVTAFHQHGTFEKAEIPPYPDPGRADALIGEAMRRGLFRLPEPDALRRCELEPLVLSDPRETDALAYFIEEVADGPGEIRIRGWAFRPDDTLRLGDIALLFRSDERMLAFEPTVQLRTDVAEANERWDATYSGFRLVLPHDQLPPGEYGLGVYFPGYNDYMMTAHTVTVPAGERTD
jgi:hypothetical protein